MCAAAAPFINIYNAPGGGGQRKYSGSHVSIRQNVNEFAKILPRKIKDIPYIWVNRSKPTDHDQKIFKIRPNKIRQLLYYLKTHNTPHYKDIEIDDAY